MMTEAKNVMRLAYKFELKGGFLIKVDPKNTSRKCPICGHTDKDNRKTQANFVCIKCGYSDNADVVGAINILRDGLSRLGAAKVTTPCDYS